MNLLKTKVKAEKPEIVHEAESARAGLERSITYLEKRSTLGGVLIEVLTLRVVELVITTKDSVETYYTNSVLISETARAGNHTRGFMYTCV